MSKTCTACGRTLPLASFYDNDRGNRCKECRMQYQREYYQKNKTKISEQKREHRQRTHNGPSYTENKSCSLYLGIHIAERVLGGYFDTIKKMPMGNKGFDFLCGRDYRVDVKSACVRKDRYTWSFDIRHNQTADYFMLLAFNNRTDLVPQHVWLIPGDEINHLKGLSITTSENGIAKWAKYEKPLEPVELCCSKSRAL